MLKEEIENGIVEDYRKTLKDLNLHEGLILNADIKIPNPNGGDSIVVDGVAFGIGKLRFAMYPHIECHFINNLQEVCVVSFISEENSGVPVTAYNESKDIVKDTVFNLNDLEKFIKDIKVGNVKVDIYLEEKKRLEEALAQLTKMLEDNGIK